jgi:L-galactose dehydrogenase
MQYRVLGRTGLQVSAIGFGASPLGDVFGSIDPEEGKRAVRLAIDEGINYFDVSPYYGFTLAEKRLGDALQGRRRDVFLATKCGRYGTSDFDFSADRLRSGLEDSLRRLGTDYVDVLLAHDIEFGDLHQIIGETIPAMSRLQEEGKARFIGISGYPLKPLIHVARTVPVDVILSYCHYNLLADAMNSMLAPLAESQNIGLINASPLHMGLLTEHAPPDWHPAPNEMHEAVKRAAEYCRQHGSDLSRLALRFCFDYPHAASTLVGMSSREDVYRNLRAFEAFADAQMVRQISVLLAPVFNRFWQSGRKENQD